MDSTQAEESIFLEAKENLLKNGFNIVEQDLTRPWGGFFVIDEDHAQQFANTYFDGIEVGTLKISGKLSPKFLIIAPNKRLSWQYHHRRAEIWQVIKGTVGVVKSMTDEETELRSYNPGERIVLQQGERHRLIGLNDWGLVAEIWQHTDASNPSDESDIVRLQDDFGR